MKAVPSSEMNSRSPRVVAMARRRHAGPMVVTNNINAANILREVPSAEVVIAGGLVRYADGGVVGEAAVDFIRQFRVDCAVIGASVAAGPEPEQSVA